MQISTTRFGLVAIQPEDILLFPEGLLGLEDCHRWVLLADGDNGALAWLQSTSRPEIALAVVHPRRFVPQYQLRVARRELEPLELDSLADAEMLAVVSSHADDLTLNLKAPLVMNVSRRLGRQVIADGQALVRHEVAMPTRYPAATSVKQVA